MSINTLEFASKFSGELDKIIVQKAVTGFLTDNVFRQKFVGAKTVIVPDIDFVGLADYDRDEGYAKGKTTIAHTSFELSKDRGRQLQLDREDLDETGVANLAGQVLGEFARTQVVPEMDAYVLSKLAGVANTQGNSHAESGTGKYFADFITATNGIYSKAGYDEELVAFVDNTFYTGLMNSEEFTKNVVVSDFKKGDINLKVKTINGVAIIPVADSRMKTAFTFGDNGFAADTGAKDIRLLVLPKKAASLVKKTETIVVYDFQNMQNHGPYNEEVFEKYLQKTGKYLDGVKYNSLYEYYLAEFNTPKAKIDLGNELNNYLSEAGYENLDGFLSDYKYAQSAIEVKTNNPGYTMAEMAMSDPEFKKIVSEWKGDINFQEWHNINYLTDEQKKVLIYFLSKGNGDTTLANNYLNAIGSELAYKEGKEIAEKYKSSTWDSVWYDFGNAVANSLNFTDYLNEMANGEKGQHNIKKRVGQLYINNQWKPYYSASEVAASINHENLPEGFWKSFDSTLTNLGQQLPSLMFSTVTSFASVGVARVGGSGITGLSAAGNTYREALIQGYSHDESQAYAILNGTSEAVLSFLLDGVGKAGGAITKPLTNKLKNSVTKSLAKIAGKHGESALLKILGSVASWGVKKVSNGGSEFIEEYLQGVLDPQIRNWTLNENNEFEFFDEQALEEGLIGVFSSFLTGAAGDVVNAAQSAKTYVQYANLGSKIKKGDNAQAVLDYALSLENSEIQKLIKQGTSANNISNNLLGRVYVEVQKDISQNFGKAVGGEQVISIFQNIAQSTDSVYIKQFALQEATLNLISSTDIDILKTVSTEENTQTTEVKEGAIADSNVNSDIVGSEVEATANDVDSDAKSGYNSVRGEENVDNQGNARESTGERQKETASDSGGKSQIESPRREDAESFSRRTQGTGKTGNGKVRNYLSNGKYNTAYTTGQADNSNGYRATQMMKQAGAKVIFCDGVIEINDGETTTFMTSALTMPDGTVYISNGLKQSGAETAAHEIVHVKMILGDAAYVEFEAVVANNIDWNSTRYDELAREVAAEVIDKRASAEEIAEHGGRDAYIDEKISDLDFAKTFLREITAVVNQLCSTDMDAANSLFDGLFTDWNAVVEASRKFNKDIGADFSESASFMSEGESVLPKVSAEGPEADWFADEAFKARGLERLTDGQKFIKSVGKAFGREVRFANLDKSVKGKDGQRRLFSPNGYFDENTGEIWINTSTAKKHDPLGFIIKHELTEFAETNPKSYSNLMSTIKNSKEFELWLRQKTKSKTRTVDQMVSDLAKKERETRENYGIKQGPYKSTQEVYANFIGDVLFEKGNHTLDTLISRAEAKQKPAFIQAILDVITWLKEKLKGNKEITFELVRLESKYVNALKKAQKAWEQRQASGTVQNKNSTNDGGKGYSIVKDSKNRDIVMLDRNIFNNIADIKKRGEALEDWIIKNFGGQKYNTSDFRFILVNERTAGKMKFWNENMDEAAYKIKLSAAEHIDELIKLAKHDRHGRNYKDKHKEFAKHGWDYFKVYFTDGTRVYVADMSTAKTDNGSVLYNIGQIDDVGAYNKNKKNSYSFTGSPNELVTIPNDRATNRSSNDSIPTSAENVKSESESGQYSLPNEEGVDYTAEMDALDEQYRNGEIDRGDYLEQMNDLYRKAGETYGTIEEGETVTGGEDFDNPVPKSVDGNKTVHRHVRTVIEGGNLTPEMLDVIKQQILSGDLSYTPTSNEANMKYAEQAITKGVAQGMWEQIANGDEAPNAGGIAVGETLLKLAVERKDAVNVVKLTAELCEVATRSGQVVQAFSLLKRMDGIGQLYYVQKSVNSLNKDLQKKHGNKAPIITIDESLAQQLAESKTTEDFDYTYSAIMHDIANQVPSTFLDKWNAWRYMAMLLNPTTHIRNIFGNGVFCPAIKIKDTLAWVGERFISESERTKSVVVGKAYKEFAKNDFANVESIIKGTGKMNPKHGIQDNKRIFKTRWLEWMRKKNFDLLESEDLIFLKGHYTRALGGYLQAQKVDLKNVKPDVLAKARDYAIGEALKATYRDTSALATVISQLSQKNAVANVLVEGVLPFKKTPINIIKRGIEYSPYGLIKTVGKGIYDLSKGNFNAAQFIDGLSANLTGAGIFALGMWLSSLGVVLGGFGDDEEDWYDKLLGMQEYSIQIGDFSYTIDWAAPACMPFFMGVSVAEANEAEGSADWFAATMSALGSGLEPFINLSMLSGIQDTIASARYSDADEIAKNIGWNIVSSYFSQTLPTLGSKFANLADPVRRMNYIDKTSKVPAFVQEILNTLYSKVPFLSTYKTEYVDAWGQTQTKGGFVKRFFQNFISPGYMSDVEIDKIDEEIKRLANETGEEKVFPKTAPRYFRFKNYKKDLSAEDYVIYAEAKGQISADYINELINHKKYQKLTDEQKVEVISSLYEFANAKAKTKLSYSYDETNAMHNGTITQQKWESYNNKTKQALAEEYFLDKYKTVFAKERNGGSAVEYYINQVNK